MGAKTGRTRPRVTSMRVGNLAWVLTREAALHVLLPFAELPQTAENLRRVLCDHDTFHVRRDALRLLRRDPWRCQWPQPTLFTPEELDRAGRSSRVPATTEPPPDQITPGADLLS